MKRTPGRPKLDDEADTVRISVSMPSYTYDYLIEAAKQRDISVPELVRQQLPADSKRSKN